MKRIAVLTWFNRGRNYGQTLQAFALNHTLRKMGVQCELLSYGKNGPRLTREEIDRLTGPQRELQLKFAAFVKAHINYSPRLREPEEVRRYLQEQAFDAVVCGSDQIWNMALSSFESVYMLDFPLPYRKVSYAAGMMDVPFFSAADRYPQLFGWLEDFDAVSVRENAAKTLIQTRTGGQVDAAVVLDPTLLLTSEEWLQAVELPPLQREPYIFCYLFHLSETQKSLIRKAARAHHCDTVVFLDSLRSGAVDLEGLRAELTRTISIEMFLALIKNAAAVVTDSFHGTVFSILFEREFFSLESDSDAAERNLDRAATLLDKAGLSRRLLRRGQEDAIDLSDVINYNAVKERIGTERQKSLAWLERSVEGVCSDSPEKKEKIRND